MAGYFLSGMAQGLQFGMQYELSKNNMDLLARQIDLKEQEMNDPEVIKHRKLVNQGLEQDISIKQTKLDAFGKQGSGGVVTPVQKTGIMQGFERLRQNASLILENPDETKRYIADLQAISNEANKVDIEGKPYFSESERAKISDFSSNFRYYAYLQKAESLKANGDNAGMASYQEAFKKDKNLTIEQRNKLVNAFDPTSNVTPSMLMVQEDIEGTIKSWTIDKKKGIPLNMNVTDIDNKIQEIQGLYQQGQVSSGFYASKMGELKAYAIKMDINKVGVAKGEGGWFSKNYDSVAQVTLSMVDGMIPPSKKNDMNTWTERYDMRSVINNRLIAEGIDPRSTNPTAVETAKRISNEVLGEITKNSGYKIFKDEDLTNPSTREVVVSRNNQEQQIANIEETFKATTPIGSIIGGFKEIGAKPKKGSVIDKANQKKESAAEVYGTAKTGWNTTKGNPYREGSVMWKQYEDNIRKGK